jgi:hypothetical protein
MSEAGALGFVAWPRSDTASQPCVHLFEGATSARGGGSIDPQPGAHGREVETFRSSYISSASSPSRPSPDDVSDAGGALSGVACHLRFLRNEYNQ